MLLSFIIVIFSFDLSYTRMVYLFIIIDDQAHFIYSMQSTMASRIKGRRKATVNALVQTQHIVNDSQINLEPIQIQSDANHPAEFSTTQDTGQSSASKIQVSYIVFFFLSKLLFSTFDFLSSFFNK